VPRDRVIEALHRIDALNLGDIELNTKRLLNGNDNSDVRQAVPARQVRLVRSKIDSETVVIELGPYDRHDLGKELSCIHDF
jgi:hypothetical protein